MTQLSFPSRPGLQTSAHPLRSLPEHWRTWAGESRLNRVWLNELIVGDLQPMHQQLALLAVALDEAEARRDKRAAGAEINAPGGGFRW